MNATTPYKTIIRFDQAAAQEDGTIKRIVGFVHAKNMLALFDDATLDANPRSAKANNVTADIIESVNEAPRLFQFKTKGILLGTSDYQQLQRNRFELNFNNPAYEGLLDGGHNMLALGTHLLGFVLDPKEVRKIKLWEDFKQQWATHRDEVKAIRDELNFKVPVELLVPSDVDDEEVVQEFTMALMDICAARNNNAQLTTEAKANQRGFYEEIRKRMPPALAERVEWKTNEWESDHRRPIKVRDLIALAWIPLTVLQDEGLLPTESEGGTSLKFGVLPQNIYRNKGELSKLFDRLMEHPDVSKPTNGPLHELHNAAVGSAFDTLSRLPSLYDKVFLELPDAYNVAINARFGRHSAVKYRDGKKVFPSPFFGEMSAYGVPDGFILPVVYGLKSLIGLKDGKLYWVEDPEKFLDRHMKALAGAFRMPMEMAGFDPQKVAKNETSYSFMVGEVEKALIREHASA
ncbi:MAG: hypothetical protein AAF311_15020 [Pseudomonadota bacterium]